MSDASTNSSSTTKEPQKPHEPQAQEPEKPKEPQKPQEPQKQLKTEPKSLQKPRAPPTRQTPSPSHETKQAPKQPKPVVVSTGFRVEIGEGRGRSILHRLSTGDANLTDFPKALASALAPTGIHACGRGLYLELN